MAKIVTFFDKRHYNSLGLNANRFKTTYSYQQMVKVVDLGARRRAL